jgi:small subunit ribosomal protein S2
MTDVTMRRMLEAGVHFGHQTRFWNPKMAPFIFGERNKIHIINLEKTLPLYQQATEFVRKLVADGGVVLFVGSKRAARQAVVEAATRCKMPYVSQRWLGGTLTNFKTIRQSVKRLRDLDEITSGESATDFTKKELLRFSRERDKLERALGGIKDMESLPDVVFIIDVGHEDIAVREARKLRIPVVAVVDTNCSPHQVDYPIPGNDDAMRAIQLYAEGIADAVLAGKASIPEVPTGDDEFVELDEEGRPRVGKGRPARKAPAKKRPRAAKTRARADGRAAESPGGEAAPEAAAGAIGEEGAETTAAGPQAGPVSEADAASEQGVEAAAAGENEPEEAARQVAVEAAEQLVAETADAEGEESKAPAKD